MITKALRHASSRTAPLVEVLGTTRFRAPDCIEQLDVSADGRRLVTRQSGKDLRCWLWSARTGAVLRRFAGYGACFHRERPELLVHHDAEVSRVAIETGDVLEKRRFVEENKSGYDLAVHPGGLGVYDPARGFVRWDGTVVPTMRDLDPQSRPEFGPDFAVGITTSGAVTWFSLHDATSRPLLFAPVKVWNTVIRISPAGRFVAAQTSLGLFIVDLLHDSRGSLRQYAVDEYGSLIAAMDVTDEVAAVATPKGIAVVDLATRKKRGEIKTLTPSKLRFSVRDGLLWSSCNHDPRNTPAGDCLVAFDVAATRRVLPSDAGHTNRVDCVASFARGGQHEAITIGGEGTVKRWALGGAGGAPKTLAASFVVPTDRAECSRDATTLCVSESFYDGGGGFGKFVSLATGKSLRDLRAEHWAARDQGVEGMLAAAMRLCPDGSEALRVAMPWGARTGSVLQRAPRDPGVPLATLSSVKPTETDGVFLDAQWLDDERAAVHFGSATYIVRPRSDELLARHAHEKWEYGTQVHSLGERDVLRYRRGNLARFDLAAGTVTATPRAHIAFEYPLGESLLRVSPDGRLAVVNTAAGAEVYETSGLRRVAQLHFYRNAGRITDACFTADSSRLLVGTKRSVVLVYDVSALRPRVDAPVHPTARGSARTPGIATAPRPTTPSAR